MTLGDAVQLSACRAKDIEGFKPTSQQLFSLIFQFLLKFGCPNNSPDYNVNQKTSVLVMTDQYVCTDQPPQLIYNYKFIYEQSPNTIITSKLPLKLVICKRLVQYIYLKKVLLR